MYERRREALDRLVRARSPIPPEVLARMVLTISVGRSYAYLAGRRVIDGMGGHSWTVKKVRRAVTNAAHDEQGCWFVSNGKTG